jgi:hypothetical protein
MWFNLSINYIRAGKNYLLLFIFICIGGLAHAQENYSIYGIVKDDKGPLPGATVFLTGTKAITACDNNGKFHLDKISPGSYGLVVSMIGFVPQSVPVIVKGEAVEINLVLKINTNVLSEVVIRAETNWKDHFEEFEKQFLGTTPNAKNCKILNPKVLYFHYDKQSKILTASADEFLIIQNNALGYQIKYLLTDFKHDNINNILGYQGYPSFKDMVPGSAKEADLWNRNRQTAYNGSITHFLKSIYNNKLYTSGFEVFKIINKPPPGVKYDGEKPIVFDEHPVLFDSLLTVTDKNFKNLTYKDALFVLYTKEKESFAFINSGNQIHRPKGAKIPLGQITLVNLMNSNVSLDSQGNFSPSSGLLFEGHMGWEQIADLTPLEFVKEEK